MSLACFVIAVFGICGNIAAFTKKAATIPSISISIAPIQDPVHSNVVFTRELA